MKKIKIHKTLKFKFTLWYSILLSIFCITFVFSIDIWLDRYMNQNIHNPSVFFEERPRRRALSPELREIVHESRMHDLKNIRRITRYSLIPLIFLSVFGGYTLSSILLRPLEDLNAKIHKKTIDNLDKKIQFKNNEDEISELIQNFNLMSERLSKAFESQKQFVENASHEIKTPLSIIQANLDTILDKKDISEKERRGLIKNSKKQIKYMDSLTEDLFLLSHMSSKIDIKMKKVNLQNLIEKLVLDFQDQINIVFKKNNKDLKILGNTILLERAFTNIISNSIKYSEGDRVLIQIKKTSKEILIEISDNGKGISNEYAEKIFERFYRIDKGRSREKGGSGLGLAITKEIIERHSGNILLDGKYDKGAKFVIHFPLL